jgi:hypothetical protein
MRVQLEKATETCLQRFVFGQRLKDFSDPQAIGLLSGWFIDNEFMG